MRSWHLRWSAIAEDVLRSIPWRDVARVDATLMRFAATGEGDFERIPNDPTGAWFRVGSYRVRLILDRRERVISVLYVWRAFGN